MTKKAAKSSPKLKDPSKSGMAGPVAFSKAMKEHGRNLLHVAYQREHGGKK